jgi:DNA-binding GntR family transcriptional regulator
MLKVIYQDLTEKVYLALREMILRNELTPGEKLVQMDLSARLGVSRTPLLSALAKLEKELLVEFIPRRGAFVRKCSIEDLKHCYDIRIRLETLAAREAAAATATHPEAVQILQDQLVSYRSVVGIGDLNRIKEADHAFHMKIVDLSRNVFLLNMIASFSIVLMSNQRGLFKPASKSLAEHEAITAAIAAGDAAQAEQLMLDHLDESRRAVEAMMRSERITV